METEQPRPLDVLKALGTYQGMTDKEIEKIIIDREVQASRKARRRGDAVNASLARQIQNNKDRDLAFNYFKMINTRLAEMQERARNIYSNAAAEYRSSYGKEG